MFFLFVCFLHILQVENKNTDLHFYRHIQTTKIDYVETRCTRHKVYTVRVHGAHCKNKLQNNNRTKETDNSKTVLQIKTIP